MDSAEEMAAPGKLGQAEGWAVASMAAAAAALGYNQADTRAAKAVAVMAEAVALAAAGPGRGSPVGMRRATDIFLQIRQARVSSRGFHWLQGIAKIAVCEEMSHSM